VVSSVSLQQLAGVLWVFAQGGGAAIDLIWWLKAIIIIAFAVGVAYLILRYYNLLDRIPWPIWYILWGFVLVVLALIAITYLSRFL
jgi:hypothetical protein